MNKYVYLFELRKELSFMTPEDTDSAVRFYEELFADAGVENEKQTIENLGPPAKLAAEIRREYEDGATEPSGRDLSTIDGAQSSGADTSTSGIDNSRMDNASNSSTSNSQSSGTWQGTHWTGPNPPWREGDAADSGEQSGAEGGENHEQYEADWQNRSHVWSRKASEWGARAGYKAGEWGAKAGEKAEEWGRKAGEWGEKAGYKAGEWGQKAEEKANEWSKDAKSWWYGTREDQNDGSRRYGPYHGRGGHLPAWAWVLIAVFTIPIWMPIIAGIFGLIIAAFTTVIGLLIAGVGTGVGLVAGGVALIIKGIFTIYRFGDALACIGAGLVMTAAGIPLIGVTIWGFRRVWRAMTRGVSMLWSKVRGRGSQGYEK